MPHILGINAEIRLQRVVDFDTGRDVDKAATTPDSAVKRGKLIVRRGNHRAEVFFHQIGVFTQRGIGIEKDNTNLVEFFLHVVVDHFRIVLRTDTGEELPLGFGNAEPIEGLLDVVGHVIPAPLATIGGFDVVVDVVEVEFGQISAPFRHRFLLEYLVGFQAILAHPIRLALDVAHLVDNFWIQTLP